MHSHAVTLDRPVARERAARQGSLAMHLGTGAAIALHAAEGLILAYVVALAKLWAMIQGDVFLPLLLISFVLDTIVGVLCSLKRGEFSVKALTHGVFYKKVSILCAVLFCFEIQRATGIQTQIPGFVNGATVGFGSAAAFIFMVFEGTSIFRNLGFMGVKTPAFIRAVMAGFRKYDEATLPSSYRARRQEVMIEKLDELEQSGEFPVSNHTIDIIKEEIAKPPLLMDGGSNTGAGTHREP